MLTEEEWEWLRQRLHDTSCRQCNLVRRLMEES
jgi:hypothetical protein